MTKIINPYAQRDAQMEAIHQKEWTRFSKNLEPVGRLHITDVDIVARKQKGDTEHILIAEKKINSNKMSKGQIFTYKIIDAALKAVSASGMCIPVQVGSKTYYQKIEYHGCHTLTFDGYTFDDAVKWDDIEVSQEELKTILTLEADRSYYTTTT